MSSALPSGVQTLRFRRPHAATAVEPSKGPSRHTGLLQDKVRRSARPLWMPSFSLAFRILLLLRFSAAMYANIQDCDEVFNFWEPLHYLDKGFGFQTWETSPQYAIRSWAYILLHLLPSRLPALIGGTSKRQSFFAVRIVLSFASSFCEAKFYRSVVDSMNDHLGRYMLFMMLFSTGMWNASSAFIPSSFAMYTTLLAFSFCLQPPSQDNRLRTLSTVVLFAMGAIVGWPFSLLLALPFVLEELFVYGTDRVSSATYVVWLAGRARRLITSGLIASLIFIPVVAVDSWAYGRMAITPWNIIRYNIFGGPERGPELYGIEPWYYYLLNLLLNFNIILPLALVSLPALAVTHAIDYRRLGIVKHHADESSPYTVVAMRLLPLYVWLGVLSAQPHKEERFMYPAYPLVCFNAATTLYLVRGWAEVAYVQMTSLYAAAQTSIFRYITLSTIIISTVLSCGRILALNHYYHAPLDVSYHLEIVELPRLLNVTSLLPPPRPRSRSDNHAYDGDEAVDLGPIKLFGLRMCYGKEWYRFPGHYLVPDGVEVKFIRSDFDGLLPRHFELSSGSDGLWKREQTRIAPPGLNDVNREEKGVYVDVATCDYLVDLDFPVHPVESINEPRYAIDNEIWDRVYCVGFLDAKHSSLLTRTLYLRSKWWQDQNSFGDYCLLRNKARMKRIESAKWERGPVP